MTDYYVDPTATGLDDGTTWTNAWTTLQRAIDGTNGTQPGIGDTVYCKANGTTADETLAAAIDMDGTSGTTAGLVKFIGVNSSGVNDGTRYLINANSQATGIMCSGSYKFMENFEVYGSGGDGVDWTNSAFDSWKMKNLVSRDNTGSGFDLYYSSYNPCLFIECQAYSNGSMGFESAYRGSSQFIHCVAHSNTSHGFQGGGTVPQCEAWIGCLSYENGGDNFNQSHGGLFYQCVADGSTGGDGINATEVAVLIGCRITNNNTAGIDIDGPCIKQYCYLGGNGTDEVGTLGHNLLHKGATTVTTGGTDTDHGYNDPTNDDYSLTSDATYRRSAIDLEQ